MRNIREEAKKELGESDISEDEQFRKEKEMQKLVDEFNQKIKEMQENKEKETLATWFYLTK